MNNEKIIAWAVMKDGECLSVRRFEPVASGEAEGVEFVPLVRFAEQPTQQEPVGCEGAIVNGRVYADRLERDYKFECEAGQLHMCTDWVELRRCFEWLAQHTSQPEQALRAAPVQQEPVEYLYRVDVSRRKNNECTTYDHPIYFHSRADASNYCWAINRADWPKNTIVIAESAAIKIAPQPAQRKPLTDKACTWKQVDSEHTPDTWESNCGAMWTFTDGGPKENGMNYCHKCGKPLSEAAHGIKENT